MAFTLEKVAVIPAMSSRGVSPDDGYWLHEMEIVRACAWVGAHAYG
jgi:hypothetical protein